MGTRPAPWAGSCAGTGGPYLRECDPLTGALIRSSKATSLRYERNDPDELVHMDVKETGKIPGGWVESPRPDDGIHWRQEARPDRLRLRPLSDRRPLPFAYSEILPNEKGTTCAAFLRRTADYFAAHGINRIERVMSDNHWSYRHSHDMAAAIATLNATHTFIKPQCPRQNAKVERLNHTLQTERADRQVFASKDSPRPADCHQADGRVHLDAVASAVERSWPGAWEIGYFRGSDEVRPLLVDHAS